MPPRLARCLSAIRRFASDEEGATAVEYAVMCALIIVTLIAAIGTLGYASNDMYLDVNNSLSTYF